MESKTKEPIIEVKPNRPTSTIEDYLGAIYTLERDGEKAIGARLAELLRVSPPTVTTTLKRMVRDGWIVSDEHKSIHLTSLGDRAARDVIRRHMLAELMLAHMLNMPWSVIHDEAGALEHSISTEIEQRMVEQFQNPDVCPHGNPLPGHEGVTANWIPIAGLPVGTRAVIRRIHEQAEDNQSILKYLEGNHLVPNVEIRVVDSLPFNQTITIERDGGQVTLGFSLAEFIFVEVMQ